MKDTEIAIESHRFADPDVGLRFYAYIYATTPPNEEDGEELPKRAGLIHRGGNFPSHDEAVAYARGWLDCKRNPSGYT